MIYNKGFFIVFWSRDLDRIQLHNIAVGQHDFFGGVVRCNQF